MSALHMRFRPGTGSVQRARLLLLLRTTKSRGVTTTTSSSLSPFSPRVGFGIRQQGQQPLQQLRHASNSSTTISDTTAHGDGAPLVRPRTAIFFPGQGVQKVGMVAPWLEAFPTTSRQTLEEVDSILGYRLSRLILEGPHRDLSSTVNAQPAIMATSILILRVLERDFGFKVSDRVDVSLGHSLGEFAALVAAGILQFPYALHMVRRRAEAMAEATVSARERHGGEYGMVALITEPEYLRGLVDAVHDFVGHHHHRRSQNLGEEPGSEGFDKEDPTSAVNSIMQQGVPPIDQVLIANINSKNQIVLSGNVQRIKELVAHVRQFLGHDPRAVRLNSDSPFHSPIMRPAVQVMRDLLLSPSPSPGERGKIVTFPGKIECISNVTARPFGSEGDVVDLLSRQCLETVRWWESIKYLDEGGGEEEGTGTGTGTEQQQQQQRKEGVRRWLGIGPGKVGRNLVGKEVGMRGYDGFKGGGVWAITDPVEIEGVLRDLERSEGMGGG